MLLNCGVGEDSWESIGLQSNQSVHPTGNQPWIFIWRTDAEAETPILRPPDAKNWLLGKDPHAGKGWRQEDKGMTDNEMVGWHHLPWWTWVGARSSSWWWIGKPDVLQFMGLQRVGHDWATELTDHTWAGHRGLLWRKRIWKGTYVTCNLTERNLTKSTHNNQSRCYQ